MANSNSPSLSTSPQLELMVLLVGPSDRVVVSIVKFPVPSLISSRETSPAMDTAISMSPSLS